ncbi:MAG: proline dehydrogenase [Solirubrobacterales bacterium]|jgi:RHH-type proline utilization regulon transcriptional repressor/proline dehydrogenase/delta 1-pyrroline-5-carboxylate dehydrogenase|nr:proline dehydrogenase [Solirubrobacterales bacterium]
MIEPGSGGLESPSAPLEAEVQRIGRELAARFPSPVRHPLRSLDQKAMQLTAQDSQLAAALFRLVDVTPACRSVDDLSAHLVAYLDEIPDRPASLDAASRLGGTAAGRKALGAATAAGVRHMAHRFIVGESPHHALRTLSGLWREGIASSVDLLGEATVTTAEADRYAARCAEALETLSAAAPGWPAREWLERDSTGPVPRVNLSVKVSALTPLMRPRAPEVGREDAAARMRPLLRRARDLGAHLHVDMESVDSLETTAELVLGLLAEPEFAEGPSSGVVLQAYLRDSPAQLERLLGWSRATPRATPLVVRLVKGAYWDHEVVEARQHGWSPPVFEHKADCDRNFEALTRRLLDAVPLVRVNIGSHNLRSVAHAIAYNRLAGGSDADLELQVLRGLGDELAEALRAERLRVRSYCPVGDLVAGMAYLVRRLLENTSNDSFLRAHHGGAPVEELLAAP